MTPTTAGTRARCGPTSRAGRSRSPRSSASRPSNGIQSRAQSATPEQRQRAQQAAQARGVAPRSNDVYAGRDGNTYRRGARGLGAELGTGLEPGQLRPGRGIGRRPESPAAGAERGSGPRGLLPARRGRQRSQPGRWGAPGRGRGAGRGRGGRARRGRRPPALSAVSRAAVPEATGRWPNAMAEARVRVRRVAHLRARRLLGRLRGGRLAPDRDGPRAPLARRSRAGRGGPAPVRASSRRHVRCHRPTPAVAPDAVRRGRDASRHRGRHLRPRPERLAAPGDDDDRLPRAPGIAAARTWASRGTTSEASGGRCRLGIGGCSTRPSICPWSRGSPTTRALRRPTRARPSTASRSLPGFCGGSEARRPPASWRTWAGRSGGPRAIRDGSGRVIGHPAVAVHPAERWLVLANAVAFGSAYVLGAWTASFVLVLAVHHEVQYLYFTYAVARRAEAARGHGRAPESSADSPGSRSGRRSVLPPGRRARSPGSAVAPAVPDGRSARPLLAGRSHLDALGPGVWAPCRRRRRRESARCRRPGRGPWARPPCRRFYSGRVLARLVASPPAGRGGARLAPGPRPVGVGPHARRVDGARFGGGRRADHGGAASNGAPGRRPVRPPPPTWRAPSGRPRCGTRHP